MTTHFLLVTAFVVTSCFLPFFAACNQICLRAAILDRYGQKTSLPYNDGWVEITCSLCIKPEGFKYSLNVTYGLTTDDGAWIREGTNQFSTAQAIFLLSMEDAKKGTIRCAVVNDRTKVFESKSSFTLAFVLCPDGPYANCSGYEDPSQHACYQIGQLGQASNILKGSMCNATGSEVGNIGVCARVSNGKKFFPSFCYALAMADIQPRFFAKDPLLCDSRTIFHFQRLNLDNRSSGNPALTMSDHVLLQVTLESEKVISLPVKLDFSSPVNLSGVVCRLYFAAAKARTSSVLRVNFDDKMDGQFAKVNVAVFRYHLHASMHRVVKLTCDYQVLDMSTFIYFVVMENVKVTISSPTHDSCDLFASSSPKLMCSYEEHMLQGSNVEVAVFWQKPHENTDEGLPLKKFTSVFTPTYARYECVVKLRYGLCSSEATEIQISTSASIDLRPCRKMSKKPFYQITVAAVISTIVMVGTIFACCHLFMGKRSTLRRVENRIKSKQQKMSGSIQ